MTSLQRRLWEAVEPLHAVVYFAPETAAAAKAVGLPGWWMGYFAGRVAPLGPLPEPPVTAMLFGFAPRMVARSMPDAWKYAEPAAVLQSRMDAVEVALGRILPADAPWGGNSPICSNKPSPDATTRQGRSPPLGPRSPGP